MAHIQVSEVQVSHTRSFAETPTSLRLGSSLAVPLRPKPTPKTAKTWAAYARHVAHAASPSAQARPQVASPFHEHRPATSYSQPLPREALAAYSLVQRLANHTQRMPRLPQPSFVRYASYAFAAEATVAVIGSGVAALAAARRLVEGGVPAANILILESSDYVGSGSAGFAHHADGEHEDEDELDDVLLLPRADFANPLSSRLSLYFETNAVLVSPWHARVTPANELGSSRTDWSCQHLHTITRELHLAEFARRAERLASDFAETLSSDTSLQRRLIDTGLLSADAQRLLPTLLAAGARPRSSTWSDLLDGGHEVALVDGMQALLRELLQGPLLVTAGQRNYTRRTLLPNWASKTYLQHAQKLMHRRPPAHLMETHSHSVTGKGKSQAQAQGHIAANRQQVKHQLRAAAQARAMQAAQAGSRKKGKKGDNVPVSNRALSSVSERQPSHRVVANELKVRRGLGRLRIDWAARRHLHREMMKQDARVWSKVYDSLAEAGWPREGDRLLMDVDPELARPHFGGVEGPIQLLHSAEAAVNERPRVRIVSEKGGHSDEGENRELRFEADYVIVASPLHLLPDQVKFSPPLPEQMTAAISRVGVALTVRVQLEFEHVRALSLHIQSFDFCAFLFRFALVHVSYYFICSCTCLLSTAVLGQRRFTPVQQRARVSFHRDVPVGQPRTTQGRPPRRLLLCGARRRRRHRCQIPQRLSRMLQFFILLLILRALGFTQILSLFRSTFHAPDHWPPALAGRRVGSLGRSVFIGPPDFGAQAVGASATVGLAAPPVAASPQTATHAVCTRYLALLFQTKYVPVESDLIICLFVQLLSSAFIQLWLIILHVSRHFPSGMHRAHFEALQQPLADALVLADSYQRPQDIGTLHGAYHAGAQAAERILTDIEDVRSLWRARLCLNVYLCACMCF